MTTALLYDPIFLKHFTPHDHPEQPARLQGVLDTMNYLHWNDRVGLVHLSPRAASIEELSLVHDLTYIQRVQHAAARAGRLEAETGRRTHFLATDTYVSEYSYEAAIRAAGAPLTAVDALMKGEIDNAYCLVRPPGHHALVDSAMGFCLFNNVSVAARYAMEKYGLERVMIIDYDVHHGNGTQDTFYEDPRVLYFSIHQAPFYPGTGHSDERGIGPGEGLTINVPLPANTDFRIYEAVFRQVLAPAADRFDPQLILVSAGFDMHFADPLGEMSLSTAGIAQLNKIILDFAGFLCQGRVIMVQEGGYNLDAMASCVTTCLNLLLGDDAAVDNLGPAPDQAFTLNLDVLIAELRRIHKLTGYRMRNAPKPDRAKLLREIKGPGVGNHDESDVCEH
jgi:acetoin utilization deacetylase AcuC-like enzyme